MWLPQGLNCPTGQGLCEAEPKMDLGMPEVHRGATPVKGRKSSQLGGKPSELTGADQFSVRPGAFRARLLCGQKVRALRLLPHLLADWHRPLEEPPLDLNDEAGPEGRAGSCRPRAHLTGWGSFLEGDAMCHVCHGHSLWKIGKVVLGLGK